jgi:hypothetical protein
MIFLDKDNWIKPETYSDPEEPLIILCEQNWSVDNDFASRSSLEGIVLAKHLRRVKKVTNPIIFTSFLSSSYLAKDQNAQIIATVGHQFLRLPYQHADLSIALGRSQPLNDMQLKDIVANFCSIASAFSETMHAFKNKLRALLNQSEKEDELTTEISTFRKLLSEQYCDYPGIIETFEAANRDKVGSTAIAKELLNQTDNLYLRFLPSETADSEFIAIKQYAWKVLILDDEPEGIKHIYDEFNKRGIEVVTCKTVAEAKAVIENDGCNSITVVISDFRLMESPTHEWPNGRTQDEQGYDFLFWLSAQRRYNAMVALSGLSRQFLSDSFRMQQLDIKVYSKNEVDNGARLFADDMEYLGDNFFDMVAHQPDWKEVGDIYKEFRLSKNFQVREKEISNRAYNVCKDIYTQVTLSEDVEDMFISLLAEFGDSQQEFTEKDTKEDTINKLITKLVRRRIALYCICIGINREVTAQLLSYGDRKKTIAESNQKQVFLKLYLKTSEDFPHRILSEERRWLQQEMGIPVYEMSHLLDATVPILNQLLNKIQSGLKPSAKFEVSKGYLDSKGNICCVSIIQLKALVNKLLGKNNDSQLRRQLMEITYNLLEVMPKSEDARLLAKALEKFEENENRRLSRS